MRPAARFRILACSLVVMKRKGWYSNWLGMPSTQPGITSSCHSLQKPRRAAQSSDSKCFAGLVGLRRRGGAGGTTVEGGMPTGGTVTGGRVRAGGVTILWGTSDVLKGGSRVDGASSSTIVGRRGAGRWSGAGGRDSPRVGGLARDWLRVTAETCTTSKCW